MTSLEGPDQVLPNDDLITDRISGSVKLRKTAGYPGDLEPMSLVTFTKKQCQVSCMHHFLPQTVPLISPGSIAMVNLSSTPLVFLF